MDHFKVDMSNYKACIINANCIFFFHFSIISLPKSAKLRTATVIVLMHIKLSISIYCREFFIANPRYSLSFAYYKSNLKKIYFLEISLFNY